MRAAWYERNGPAAEVHTMPNQAKAQAAADIVKRVEAVRLDHQIGARFPLDRSVEAHQAHENGRVMGNIVVDGAPG